jgi:leucine dehydrogenase
VGGHLRDLRHVLGADSVALRRDEPTVEVVDRQAGRAHPATPLLPRTVVDHHGGRPTEVDADRGVAERRLPSATHAVRDRLRERAVPREHQLPDRRAQGRRIDRHDAEQSRRWIPEDLEQLLVERVDERRRGHVGSVDPGRGQPARRSSVDSDATADDPRLPGREPALTLADVTSLPPTTLLGLDASHEQIQLFCDRSSGLFGAVAVHSTVLGPAMGGLRRAHYATGDELVQDAMRLSQAMTYKNAAAGLDLGGGKAVVLDDGRWDGLREPRLRAFGEVVERLGGRYIAAEDVGTTPADMAVLAQETDWVAGRPTASGGMGDPSPATARSVFARMLVATKIVYGRPSLEGRSVGILGLGAVGLRLSEMVHSAGARLIVADIDEARTAQAHERFQAQVVTPDALLRCDMDIFAPCALGGVIGSDASRLLRCTIIAGAANNPLTDDRVADDLHRRGVLFVPDFLANCGGIIHVGAEVLGFTPEEVDLRIGQAVDRTHELLREASRAHVSPLGLAKARALDRLRATAEVIA